MNNHATHEPSRCRADNALVDALLYRAGRFTLLMLVAVLIATPPLLRTVQAQTVQAPTHRAALLKAARAAVNPLLVAAADEARITANDGVAGDAFGWSVAIDGDRALVGAYGDESYQGAAYIFAFDGTTWTQQAKLTATDGVAYDLFGWSVAISGDRALVGASWDDTFQGAAYVFVFDGTTWVQEARLTAADGVAGDEFGQSVAIDGDRALVGVYGDESYQGAAYVFAFDGTAWQQEDKLIADDAGAGDNLGVAVSLDGDRALVGADGRDENGEQDAGAAYVFAFDGTAWSQQAKLTAAVGAAFDFFGQAVSLDGDRALVGAPLADDNGASAGAAYVFAFDGTAWQQEIRLVSDDLAANDNFGQAVALSGSQAFVGAVGDDDLGGSSGSVYVFAFDGATWQQANKLTASDGAAGDFYGNAIALDGDRAVIGSPGSQDAIGAAYAFASDDVLPPLPHPYLFIADVKITIDGHVGSAGDIHSNRDIAFKKGNPSTYTGIVTAVRNVKIDKDNTVEGDVTAGGSVERNGNATVTGVVTEGASVAPIPIPALDPFTAGTTNVQVPQNGSLTLTPGAYRDVEVDKDGVLLLSSGVYFFRKLELKEAAVVSFDVAGGPVTVNVVEEIDFKKEAEVAITPLGEAGTRYVTFNLLGDKEIGVDKDARMLGNIIAPSAKVHVKKEGFFRGAICASEIDVDQDATLLQHDASLPAMPSSVQVATPAQTAADRAEATPAQERPEGYRLASNYPNPFNPVTAIAFALPEAAPVRLVVYDVTGRVVARLVDGSMAAGTHRVRFDASGLPSGVYLYQLTAGPFTETRRMVLVK